MSAGDLIFWASLLLFLYAYAGYPLLITLLARLRHGRETARPEPPSDAPATYPEVTIVLCVHNAAAIVQARIANLLALDYPADKLQMIVVSDGSTDSTDAVINAIGDDRIQLLSYPDNRGKAYALSQALPRITSEYALFVDARQWFEADALKQLLEKIRQPDTGAVTGNLVIGDGKGSPGLYWRYETHLRAVESTFHTLVGVAGAIYLARTALLPKALPEGLILDDMYVPLSMVRGGYRVKFCPGAIAHDTPSGTLKEEFDRKVRTLAGNYQLFRLLPWTLNPLRNPAFLQLFSHKVLRLLVPYLLIAMLVTSAASQAPLLQLAFGTQVLLYLATGWSYAVLYRRKDRTNILLTFFTLNLAALKASWVHWGTPQRLWKRH